MARRGPIRVGQFAAFYGDRRDAIRQLLDADVDVLTGDYLAELTLIIMKKNALRGREGYAAGFLAQLDPHLAEIASRGVKVITNAGGLDPGGCAEAIRARVADLGLSLKVASVHGDDLLDQLPGMAERGETFRNLDTDEPLAVDLNSAVAANAYLGAWPIVAALDRGADIVVCPRVTDGALVIGGAAHWHAWASHEFDALAGALLAGHVIECGAQATGGNYAFFDRHEPLGIPGMPIAEIASDGSSLITKPENTGGVVNAHTVTAQLLYEVGSPMYHNPDVVLDLASVRLEDLGNDRVAVTAPSGWAPTNTTKLSLSYDGGFRNTMTIGITGPNVAAKTAWLRSQMAEYIRPESDYEACDVGIVGPQFASDPGNLEEATAWMVVSVRDSDRSKVGRAAFSDAIVQLAVSSIPGFYLTTPPQSERAVAVQWPCLVRKESVRPSVLVDEEQFDVPWGPTELGAAYISVAEKAAIRPSTDSSGNQRLELGVIAGARSGDKAGLANLGVWGLSTLAFEWLAEYLTTDRLGTLLPEAKELRVERHLFPNLNAINFLLFGYLDSGVSACLRIDPQAKALGEYLRAKVVPVPDAVLDSVRNY
jgi:hypothetical protein